MDDQMESEEKRKLKESLKFNPEWTREEIQAWQQRIAAHNRNTRQGRKPGATNKPKEQ